MGRRRKGGSGGHGEGGSERWLLTYADMITLLLALFIVLFAMSTIDVVQFDALKRSLSESFNGQVFNADSDVIGGSESALDAAAPTQLSAAAVAQQQATSSQQTQAYGKEEGELRKLAKQFEKGTNLKGVEVTSTERGIVVRLAGDVFFASGSAEMNPRMETFMLRIAHELVESRRQIRVEGHTDGAPIATAAFPSNWYLSTGRALTIRQFLVEHGVKDKRTSVAGFADTKPIVPPRFGAQNIAKNRRVEIVILAPAVDVTNPRAARPSTGPTIGVPDIARDITGLTR